MTKPPSRPRLRTRGGYLPPTVVNLTEHRRINGAFVGNYTSVEGYASPTGRVEVMADAVTPDFQRRRNDGELIFNGMDQIRSELSGNSSGPSLIWIQNDAAKGTTFDVSGNYLLMMVGGIANPSDTVPRLVPQYRGNTTEIQRAISEASTRAQRSPSEASLLVSLAELDKTRRLVPDLLHNWSSLFQKLNRASAVSRNSAVTARYRKDLVASNLSALERTAVETWLAMRFGVRPLIMDTLGVLKALSKESVLKPIRLTSRGTAGFPRAETVSLSGTKGAVRVDMTEERNLNVNVRAMCLYELELTKLRDVGASLAAIPEAMIDLVRFSFVLNWVVNVNDFFAALGSALDSGLTYVGGCYVLEKNSSSLWMPISTTSVDARLAITTPVTGFILATEQHKRRSGSLDSPKLVVRADPTKFLRDFRLVDAIALLRVQTRGRGVRTLGSVSASRRFPV